MRKRNIQKIVRLSRDEAQDLQKKAKKVKCYTNVVTVVANKI